MKLATSTLLSAGLCACALLNTAMAHEAEQRRAIVVNGQGEVRAEPDRATVTLGVEARRPKLEEARAEVVRTVDAVLKLTREMKIDPKHVRATRISVQPEYNWESNSRERNLIGYYVSRQVEVELRDLERLGMLLERATDLGVNQIGDPQLDSSKRQELTREALAKAVEDARRNAEVVARAAGAKLGSAYTITANAELVPRPVPMVRAVMGMDASAEKAAGTYQRGEMTFNATVNIRYDLVAPTP